VSVERLQNSQAIEVWAVPLVPPGNGIAEYLSCLSNEERLRAGRFHFDQHRQDFILSHASLRLLLGGYLSVPPHRIRFSFGRNGKPRLADEMECPVQFNMAHSGDFAVYAFCVGCEVGIDVERIRDMPDLLDIARRFFSEAECVDLVEFPVEQRGRAFFTCWTRKEAYIKARGDGLSLALDSFRVEFDSTAPRIFEPPEATTENGWNLANLEVDSACLAALAYPGARRSITLHPALSPAVLIERAQRS